MNRIIYTKNYFEVTTAVKQEMMPMKSNCLTLSVLSGLCLLMCMMWPLSDAGVRLYFTTNPFGSQKGRASMLTLVHVRLPPGFLTSAAPQRPNNVHMAYYRQGQCTQAVCSTYRIIDLWLSGIWSVCPMSRRSWVQSRTLSYQRCF